MFALVALVPACGRVGFEPREAPGDGARDGAPPVDAAGCVTLVHDEDGDGVDDVCDVCPHLADVDQADGDGDRVGDACDPEPTIARQRIILFDPFTALDPAWTRSQGSEAAVGDQLELLAINSYRTLIRPLDLGHDTFVVSATSATAGTGQSLFAIQITPTSAPSSFYCELYDTGSRSQLQFTSTLDGIDYTGQDRQVLATRFANGAGTFSFEVAATMGRCGTTWRGQALESVGTIPSGIAREEVHLFAENVDIRVAYFLQLRTDD